MPARFSRIAGVDFSGAKEAGKAIWIAEGVPRGDGLDIDLLTRLDWLPDGQAARLPALATLRRRIASRQYVLTGMDFPFSLPAMLLGGHSWQGWLTAKMAGFASAEAFRAACRSGAGRELKRSTDREARTPFCAYNLRLYAQTYWGATELLAPLVAQSAAVVAPMMDLKPGVPTLIEICPASTLKHWWGHKGAQGYKKGKNTPGGSAARIARRREIVDALAERGLAINASMRDLAVEDEGGDAVDALLAAYATWQAWLDPERLSPRPGTTDAVEGRVYF